MNNHAWLKTVLDKTVLDTRNGNRDNENQLPMVCGREPADTFA
jgi:hypothetical protein